MRIKLMTNYHDGKRHNGISVIHGSPGESVQSVVFEMTVNT